MRHVLLILCVLPLLALAAPPYRDLMVYTASAPATPEERAIAAETTLRNRGKTPLQVDARLQPCRALGFAGAQFTARIAPGGEAAWHWRFTPPAGVKREILTGTLALNGKTDRDLFIAVQGADPADFADPGAEQITEAARVVATYAPRTRQAIQADVRARAKAQPKPVLTLAQAGKTAYTLALGEVQPDQALTAALEDLRRVVTLQSGAELPLAAAEGPAIRLRLADLSAPGLQDAYRLRTVGTDVLIEAATPDGLRNGVYGLLTDHLGCRWFMSGALGEEIFLPKDRAVRLPALDETRGSKWYSCGSATWGFDPHWDRRNRAIVNQGRMNFGHAWYGYVNQSEFPYEKFPEYYARDREGKIRLFDSDWSSTNFCSTNPEVIAIVAKKVNAFFAAHPDAPVCSLDPNDYGPMCLCDRCLALDKQYGQTKEDGIDVTDRLIHFSNEIARRLDPAYREKYLGILIYAYQMELPLSAKPHPRHAGMICKFPPRYDHSRAWNDPTSAKNRDFFRLLLGWGSQLTQLGYYDYYNHYYYFGPFGVLHTLREELPAFRELGGTFLVLESDPNFATQGVNSYVAAALQWDLDADVDLLLEDLCTRFYGPAAAPMRDYWLAAEYYTALERPGTHTESRVAARPEFWAALDDCLQRAEAITAKLPARDRRFVDRVRLARDGFDYSVIRSNYDYHFGGIARRLRRPVDHAAALVCLQNNRRFLEEIQAKYPVNDPYWPPLMAPYSLLNLDEEIKKHEGK